jgi:L-fuconolactonase
LPLSRTPTRYGRILPPNEAWLASAEPEAAIEPELPIVDAHHHLWDLRRTTGHRYLLQDMLADIATGHNVIATIYMNCYEWDRLDGPLEMRPITETEVAAGAAAMCESGVYGSTRVAAGIVSFADLTLGDQVVQVLEEHKRVGGGRFRGIRHSGGWDADPVIGNSFPDMQPDLYRQPDFQRGFSHLVRMGLSFDAWLYHPQLLVLAELAETFPDANIVLGHCGGPLGYGAYAGRQDETFVTWKASMAVLARYPNICVKLGGMMMRLAAFDYNADPSPPNSLDLAAKWRPYIETCIELFGIDRCFFESNFPVDKMGVGYLALWNAFKRIASGASQEEKRALFSGNAMRIYRLE